MIEIKKICVFCKFNNKVVLDKVKGIISSKVDGSWNKNKEVIVCFMDFYLLYYELI